MQHLDWTATLNSIKSSLPRAQYLSWIEPIELIQSDETSVRLGVPSRFHEDMLRGQLRETLLQAIEKQKGVPVQLEFQILARTNLEASRSLEVPAVESQEPTPKHSSHRPQLRVVDGSRSEQSVPNNEPAEASVPKRPSFPRFSNDFFELPFNRTALHAAKLFVTGKDPNLSTLVLVGNVGMGKTHLLADIAKMLLEDKPRLRLRYTCSDSFTAEMIQSFKEDNHAFRVKYREETDVLLFDDIHDLQGREKTQEQVLHIFNDLLMHGRRIVFTSRVPITRLTRLSEALRSRLLSMVSVEIASPPAEDRLQLLTLLAEQNRIPIEGQVLRHLSENSCVDVRELIGSLLRLHIQSKIENRPLDADYLAKQGNFKQSSRSEIGLEEIVTLVEFNFGISRQELCTKGRKSSIAWPRQVAMYLARHMTYLPLGEIGKFFGRDHATVLYAYEKVASGIQTQRDIQLQIEYLLERLRAKTPKK